MKCKRYDKLEGGADVSVIYDEITSLLRGDNELKEGYGHPF